MQVSKFETISIQMTPAEAFTVVQVLEAFIRESKEFDGVYIERAGELKEKLNEQIKPY